jgi:hypothetical protein
MVVSRSAEQQLGKGLGDTIALGCLAGGLNASGEKPSLVRVKLLRPFCMVCLLAAIAVDGCLRGPPHIPIQGPRRHCSLYKLSPHTSGDTGSQACSLGAEVSSVWGVAGPGPVEASTAARHLQGPLAC